MTSPLRKLLLLGALLWIAPVGAEPRDSANWDATDSGCPYERTEQARLERIAEKSDAPLLGHQAQSAALLP